MESRQTPRGEAFSIMFDRPPAPSSTPRGAQHNNNTNTKTPRGGGADGPKRAASFKFLKKDAGKKACDHHALDSLENTSSNNNNSSLMWTDTSRALRTAIATDMLREHKDPFADALVAVPSRPPPKKIQAESESSAPAERSTKKPMSPTVQKKRPEWNNSSAEPHETEAVGNSEVRRGSGAGGNKTTNSKSKDKYTSSDAESDDDGVDDDYYHSTKPSYRNRRTEDAGRQRNAVPDAEDADDQHADDAAHTSYGARRDLMKTIKPSKNSAQSSRNNYSDERDDNFNRFADEDDDDDYEDAAKLSNAKSSASSNNKVKFSTSTNGAPLSSSVVSPSTSRDAARNYFSHRSSGSASQQSRKVLDAVSDDTFANDYAMNDDGDDIAGDDYYAAQRRRNARQQQQQQRGAVQSKRRVADDDGDEEYAAEDGFYNDRDQRTSKTSRTATSGVREGQPNQNRFSTDARLGDDNASQRREGAPRSGGAATSNTSAYTREVDLMSSLEEERRQCEEAKLEYVRLKQLVEKERERLARQRHDDALAHQKEKDAIDAVIEEEKAEARRDLKAAEERIKSLRQTLQGEKDMNHRLKDENSALRDQLDRLTHQQREHEKLHRGEVDRLKVEIASLFARNQELMEMTKTSQQALLQQKNQQHSIGDARARVAKAGAEQPQGRAKHQHHHADGDESSHDGSLSDDEEGGDTGYDATGQSGDDGDERNRKGASVKGRVGVSPEEERRRRELMERRAREVEERFAREEKEREERRRLANKQRADKAREEEERQLKATQEAEERRRQAAEQSRMKEEEQRRRNEDAKRKPQQQMPSNGATNNVARGSTTLTAPKTVTAPSSTAQPTLSREPPSKMPEHPPSAEELVADDEPMPPLDVVGDIIVSQRLTGADNNKKETIYRSGKREIIYSNGTRKVELSAGHVVLFFTNGDIKQTWPSGKTTYWYEVAQTMHTQLSDGTEVFEFHASQQVERHHPNGTKEILYPEGIYKVMWSDGTEETLVSQ